MPRYGFGNNNDEVTGKGLLFAADQAASLDSRNLAVGRENRMAQSQALNDEVQRYQFEKQKTQDANALRMKLAAEKEGIAANEELFGIDTSHPDAMRQLQDFSVKHYRVLSGDTADPRLVKQFNINQIRVKELQDRQAKRDELISTEAQKRADRAAKIAEAQSGGLERKSYTIDGQTFAKPEVQPAVPKSLANLHEDLQAKQAAIQGQLDALPNDDTAAKSRAELTASLNGLVEEQKFYEQRHPELLAPPNPAVPPATAPASTNGFSFGASAADSAAQPAAVATPATTQPAAAPTKSGGDDWRKWLK